MASTVQSGGSVPSTGGTSPGSGGDEGTGLPTGGATSGGLEAPTGPGNAGVEPETGGTNDGQHDAGMDPWSHDAGAPVTPTATLTGWHECKAIEGYPLPPFQPPSSCTHFEVPLRIEEPEGETIEIFVKRYLRPGATRQLYLLAGGPGSTALAFDAAIQQLAEHSEADLYLFEHRGVGMSRPRLYCPEQEALSSPGRNAIEESEMPACSQYLQQEFGDDLSAFTVTAAAHDLGLVISALREPGKQVFAFGASYGTYWGHRFLQLYPNLLDGIILDAIMPPQSTGQGFMPAGYEQGVDRAGRQALELCAMDAVCRNKLGSDPVARLADLYMALSQGHCPELAAGGATPKQLKLLLSNLASARPLLAWVPALIYRAERCSAPDVDLLLNLKANLLDGAPAQETEIMLLATTQALATQITRSETMTWPAPTAEEYEQLENANLFGLLPWSAVAGWAAYPFPYSKDPWMGEYAETEIPMLMLNGTLDGPTPVEDARNFASHFTGAHQHFVPVEFVTHTVTLNSPQRDNPDADCGLLLMAQFLEDPQASLDTRCATGVAPPNFTGNAISNLLFLGTVDRYEN